MTPIQMKRLTMEQKRIEASKEELELKIMERQNEIAIIEKSISDQDKRLAEIKQELETQA